MFKILLNNVHTVLLKKQTGKELSKNADLRQGSSNSSLNENKQTNKTKGNKQKKRISSLYVEEFTFLNQAKSLLDKIKSNDPLLVKKKHFTLNSSHTFFFHSIKFNNQTRRNQDCTL